MREGDSPRSVSTSWSLKIFVRVGLSLAINFIIAIEMFLGVPQSHEIPLSGLILYAPDAGWLILVCGALAVIGLIVTMCKTAFGFYSADVSLFMKKKVPGANMVNYD